MWFNICFMDLEERQGFAQDKLVALDVREAEEQASEALEEKERILARTTSEWYATIVFEEPVCYIVSRRGVQIKFYLFD
jgi:hypothetical protein